MPMSNAERETLWDIMEVVIAMEMRELHDLQKRLDAGDRNYHAGGHECLKELRGYLGDMIICGESKGVAVRGRLGPKVMLTGTAAPQTLDDFWPKGDVDPHGGMTIRADEIDGREDI